MKCPLIIYVKSSPYQGEETEQGDCLKEECAWWDEESERCSVFVGMMSLEWIKLRLEMIEAKLPSHERLV